MSVSAWPSASVLAMMFALLAAPAAVPTFAATPPAASAPTSVDRAEVRPKAYNVGGALALGNDAGFQFQTVEGPVRLDIGAVVNESATQTSGMVRVALFVTSGADALLGSYWTIAFTDLGTLRPGFGFGPLATSVTYYAPPDGIYYVHMGVFEQEPATCTTTSGFCLDDYVSYENRVEVIDGRIYDAGPPPAPRTEAVEYYHAGFDHYFLTSFGNEIALLDRGAFSGWQRSGRSFGVWTADTGRMAGVCRFFSTSFDPRSSHFYTPYSDECAHVRGNPDWLFEAIAFHVELPDAAGDCGAGRQPLYRLYNNGQGGAPNHRYTTSLDVRQEMLIRRWIPEGAGPLGTIACVPM